MAELATIARPYAEALFKACAGDGLRATVEQVELLAAVAADPALQQFADNPKVSAKQVAEVITSVLKSPLSTPVANFLATVLDNRRLDALPEMAVQLRALANAQSGVSDAIVYSAFALQPAQLADVQAALERRFGRKLAVAVQVDETLIGGVRVVVGDEVLDTSVKARLERMKQVLVA